MLITFKRKKKVNPQYSAYINNQQIPQKNSAKYLRLILDAGLIRKHHVKSKVGQIGLEESIKCGGY